MSFFSGGQRPEGNDGIPISFRFFNPRSFLTVFLGMLGDIVIKTQGQQGDSGRIVIDKEMLQGQLKRAENAELN